MASTTSPANTPMMSTRPAAYSTYQPSPAIGAQQLSDHRSDQSKADADAQRRENPRDDRRQKHLAQHVQPRRPHGLQHVDEIAVHAAQALVGVQDDDEHDHRKRHHDLGNRSDAEPEYEKRRQRHPRQAVEVRENTARRYRRWSVWRRTGCRSARRSPDSAAGRRRSGTGSHRCGSACRRARTHPTDAARWRSACRSRTDPPATSPWPPRSRSERIRGRVAPRPCCERGFQSKTLPS